MSNTEERVATLEAKLAQLAKLAIEDKAAYLSRIDFLEGQLIGTQAALRALILASPDPAASAACVARNVERLSAIGLHSQNSDEYLRGIGWAKGCILPPPKKN
ncbi:hypothetical protein AB3X91_11875 [Paraburkholderia sp. BR14263]|uniref:hypothetical protein n=1 Tax=unclassified Paraburkholderia TaxID=2615204 RepID=UPI0034CF77CE